MNPFGFHCLIPAAAVRIESGPAPRMLFALRLLGFELSAVAPAGEERLLLELRRVRYVDRQS